MRKHFRFIIPIIFLAATPVLGEEVSLSMEEAVSIALRDNPDVRMKEQDLIRARAAIKEAQAGLLPSLSAQGSWTDTRGLYARSSQVSAGQAGARQIIYSGGTVINAVKLGRSNYEAAVAVLDRQKLDTIYSVKSAFYTLMFSQRFVEINKGIVENTRAHLASLRELYDRGQASETQVLEIEASLSKVAQALEESQNQAESVGLLLSNLLHLDTEVRISPLGEFVYEPKELALNEAFTAALEHRPEIRQAEAQERAASKNVDIAKGSSRPTVYASWDYYARSHATGIEGPVKNPNDYTMLGVFVSWPIFDGWRTKAKVEEASASLEQARILKEKTGRDITYDLTDAYLALKNAMSVIGYTQDQYAIYEKNLATMKAQYEAGMASELALQDSQLAALIARFNLTQSLYDYHVALARFERAVGGNQ